jgi:transcriptional regulator of arginine metabolism
MTRVKKSRTEAILELIKKERISDQKQLVEALKREFAIETTQAAVSRDLQKLGVIKQRVQGGFSYAVSHEEQEIEALHLGILDIVHNESMIVVRTKPGFAAFVGDYIDRAKQTEILATLAGENVLFVVPQKVKNLTLAVQALTTLLHFRKDVATV